MKLFKTSLLVMAAAALIFTGCKKEEAEDSISLSTTALGFNGKDNSPVSVNVKTDLQWKASSDASWVKVAPASGNGSCEVIISVDDNIAPAGECAEARNATINFTAGKAKATLTVDQEGEVKWIYLDGNAPVSYKGGNLELSLQINSAYSVSVDADWVKFIDTKAVKTDKLTFQIDENKSFDPRSCTISIKRDGEEDYTQTINQEGAPTAQEKTFTFASPILSDKIDIAVSTAEGFQFVTVDDAAGKSSVTATVNIADKYLIVSPSGSMAADGTIAAAPAVQDGDATIIEYAYASPDAGTITMQAINALVVANFTDSAINKVEVLSQTGDNICGSFKAAVDNGVFSLNPVAAAEDEALDMVTVNTGGIVLVSVLPNTYAKGLYARPYTADALSTAAFIDGETVLTAGSIENAVITKTFSPADGAALKDIVAQKMLKDEGGNQLYDENGTALIDNDASNIHAWRLYGTTINLAATTYDMGGEVKMEFNTFGRTVPFTFVGASKETTILDGNNSYRIFQICNNVSATFKNITFRNASAPSGNGGALVLYGFKTNTTIDNCIFKDNKIVARNDKGELSASGGSIYMTKGTTLITNCQFMSSDASAELARNGGALYTENGTDGATAVVKNCTFKDLKTYNTGGATNNSGGKQSFEGCTFENCCTQNGAGAASHANAANAEMTFKDCSFVSCIGKLSQPYETVDNQSSGLISMQEGYLTMDGCVFDDCRSSAATVFNIQSGESFNKISNCLFKNCKGASRGLVQVNGKSVTFLDNCVFDGNYTRTNAWGRIVHGGNPSAICINNCTMTNHESGQSGGNNVMVNSDGSILISNSTIINDCAHSMVRNTNANSGKNQVAVINSIVLNTNASGLVFKKDHMKAALATCYNMFSTSDPEVYSAGTADQAGQSVSSLGLSYDSSLHCYLWDGTSSTKEANAENVSAAMKAFAPTIENKRVDTSSKSLGEIFYDWVVANGNFDKSLNGVSRGSAWWPGSYQKN